MGRYILLRLVGMVGVLIAVSMITFFLMKAVPGGPFDAMAVNASTTIPDTIKKSLEAKYGLDKPVITQYLFYMRNAVHLDFGYSFYYQGQTIAQIFQNQWPYS